MSKFSAESDEGLKLLTGIADEMQRELKTITIAETGEVIYSFSICP